jgi:hypothetical protein
MLSWMRTGGSTKPISLAIERRRLLDLLGQPRRAAAGQRQQPVAELQPDHVHAQRFGDRRLGGD